MRKLIVLAMACAGFCGAGQASSLTPPGLSPSSFTTLTARLPPLPKAGKVSNNKVSPTKPAGIVREPELDLEISTVLPGEAVATTVTLVPPVAPIVPKAELLSQIEPAKNEPTTVVSIAPSLSAHTLIPGVFLSGLPWAQQDVLSLMLPPEPVAVQSVEAPAGPMPAAESEITLAPVLPKPQDDVLLGTTCEPSALTTSTATLSLLDALVRKAPSSEATAPGAPEVDKKGIVVNDSLKSGAAVAEVAPPKLEQPLLAPLAANAGDADLPQKVAPLPVASAVELAAKPDAGVVAEVRQEDAYYLPVSCVEFGGVARADTEYIIGPGSVTRKAPQASGSGVTRYSVQNGGSLRETLKRWLGAEATLVWEAGESLDLSFLAPAQFGSDRQKAVKQLVAAVGQTVPLQLVTFTKNNVWVVRGTIPAKLCPPR